MRSQSVCFTSIVLEKRYDNLPGVEYVETEVAGAPVRFAQHANPVLPVMLAELAAHRKEAKRRMAAADDDFHRAVHNAEQLAFKLCTYPPLLPVRVTWPGGNPWDGVQA